MCYKCGEVFYPEGASEIMCNDENLRIEWAFDEMGGAKNLIISDKDKHLMSFKQYTDIVC